MQASLLQTLLMVFALGTSTTFASFTDQEAPGYSKDIASLTSKRCAICHKGPYLDLETFPFRSDKFPEASELGAEILRRLHLVKWGKMPPINAVALSPEEISLLERWINGGMQP